LGLSSIFERNSSFCAFNPCRFYKERGGQRGENELVGFCYTTTMKNVDGLNVNAGELAFDSVLIRVGRRGRYGE
jgi:hypothetical protein